MVPRLRFGLATLALGAALLAAACSAGSSPTPPTPGPAGRSPTISGMVTAGPVCPVERNPPEPGCSPRPVAAAVIAVADPAGREVARATSGADGTYRVTLPGTGTFTVSGLPVQGLMRPPTPVTVSLPDPGSSATADLQYDTGIR